MNICIFGSANDDIDEDFLNQGYILGKTLANQGYNIVFGGGRDGMMGAVAKGAFENNGKVYGIAPSWISKFDDPFENCEEYIYTDGMDDRKELFFKKSDVFIITPGGIGTLDEFFDVVTLKYLQRHEKPIIIFNINNFYDDLIHMLNKMFENNFISSREIKLYEVGNTIDDILDLIENKS